MDDDELMMMLREVLAADEEVSASVLAAAEAAFQCLGVDDELADVVFDSADLPVLPGVRGGCSARQLTYRCNDLLIDCEVYARGLFGQVVSAIPVTVELRLPDGRRQPVDLDGQGRFMVEPTPAGPVSLRCQRADRRALVTPWLLT
jgi:hypothetical protein